MSTIQRNSPARLVDEDELAAELQAQQAEHLRDHRRSSSATKSKVSPGHRQPRAASASRNFAIGERTSPSAREDDIRESLRAPRLRVRLERLQLRRARTPSARRCSARTAPREHAELRAARRRRRFLDLHVEAEVRPVDAVAQHRLVVRQTLERRARAGRRCTRARSRSTMRSINPKMNSRSGNAISTSSCVSSCRRSARGSSSRKQRAIW